MAVRLKKLYCHFSYTMKISGSLKYLFISILTFAWHYAGAQAYYDKVIAVNPQTYRLIKDAIEDLQYQLGKATAQDFKLITKDTTLTSGIIIKKLDRTVDKNPAEGKLDPDNDDAFIIRSDGKNKLEIIAYTKPGLINGIYTYLDTLGFRWYHPGDEWAYTPALKDIRIKLDQVCAPDFALRTFFGTWGTPRNRVIDNTALVDRQWGQWYTRNRLGGAYNLSGHAWGTFRYQVRDSFTVHPEYTAMVNGVRLPQTAPSLKFCISNPGLQQLFVNYFVEQLKKNIKNNSWQRIFCVSVEPSDGEGDCECDACKKMGSVSNRDFFLANLVAKEFQKIWPTAYVNLYAYDTHAMPPDFALEPNVIVQIIPYKYQDYSTPEQMIATWRKKTSNLFIYDYYGLPILNVDMPLNGELQPAEYGKRVKHWHQLGIKGITLESSYGIGATGLGLYLFARLSWNSGADVNALLKDYYTTNYGKVGSTMQQVQQVLADDSVQREKALTKGMKLLNTAKTEISAEQNTRLTDYKAYLHYLKLLYRMQKTDEQMDTVASDNLLRFTYSIFFTKMVHQFPINEWLKNFGHTPTYTTKYWDTFNQMAPGMKYSSVVQYTPKQLDELFEQDCKELKE
ncbi:MAG: hypothetical protein JWO06_2926 [Bacteroidota bacterium]|nr:hypothetical protein [Bacteroidota bacterium]